MFAHSHFLQEHIQQERHPDTEDTSARLLERIRFRAAMGGQQGQILLHGRIICNPIRYIPHHHTQCSVLFPT